MLVRAKAVALFISIPSLLAAQSQSSSCRDHSPQNSANSNRTSPPDSNSRPQTNDNGSAAEGIWGGPHVRLSMSEESIQIEFDCAKATINPPTGPDAQRDSASQHTGS